MAEVAACGRSPTISQTDQCPCEARFLPVVVENNLPTAFLVPEPSRSVLDIIGHDLDSVRLGSEKMGQQGPDDRHHAGGEDDDGHVVRRGPVVEVLEARVESDLRAERPDAFGERRLHAVEHFPERVSTGASDGGGPPWCCIHTSGTHRVPEAGFSFQNVGVQLPPALLAEA